MRGRGGPVGCKIEARKLPRHEKISSAEGFLGNCLKTSAAYDFQMLENPYNSRKNLYHSDDVKTQIVPER